MPDPIFLLLGVVFGVLAGWYLASRHSHRLASLVEDQKRQAARAVRSARDQLGAQLDQTQHELSQLQTRMDEESRAAEKALAKLQADLTRASERREKLERSYSALETSVGPIKSELQAATEDAFRDLAEFHDVASSLQRVIETVESRLLAMNARLRELGVVTGDGASAQDVGQPEGAGLRDETSVR